MALTTYQSGQGVRSRLKWNPVAQIIDSLDAAFYMAFDNVEPSYKNILLALNVSSSMMYGAIAGCEGLTPRNASAAMALVTARTEPNYEIFGFCDDFVSVPIAATDSLTSAVSAVSYLPFGGTDCALPMLYALEHKFEVDMFVIYTDNETWYGDIHPKTALDMYRREMGRPAKCAVVGMVANDLSIADPEDAGMLDFIGFDTVTPTLLSDFAKDIDRMNIIINAATAIRSVSSVVCKKTKGTRCVPYNHRKSQHTTGYMHQRAIEYTHQTLNHARIPKITQTSLSKGSGAKGPPSLAAHTTITNKVMKEP